MILKYNEFTEDKSDALKKFESKETPEDFMSLFSKKEDLDPELAKYYEHAKGGIPMIRHPVLYSLFHTPEQNAFVNKQFQVKKEAALKFIKDKNWGRYVFLHERPYRLQAFQETESEMSDKEYWEILGEIWVDSENIWQNQSEWKDALSSDRPQKKYFMDDEERVEFAKLPEELTIYRGYTKGKNENGFSYSLDKTKAEWFASRFGGNKKDVKVLTVKKKDCLAYFTGRGEKEIVYLGK